MYEMQQAGIVLGGKTDVEMLYAVTAIFSYLQRLNTVTSVYELRTSGKNSCLPQAGK